MILADWDCPSCGVFEARAPSSTDAIPCPECGAASPWAPSPVAGRVKLGEVSRGKVEPPRPGWINTRELGEGMSMAEWRAKRDRQRLEDRRKILKDQLR